MNIDKNNNINNKIRWIDPLDSKEVNIYGFAFLLKDFSYNRLPLSFIENIRPIKPNLANLATNTSGGQIHFRTTSKKIILDVELTSINNISGMTAVAQGGFDFYVGSNYKDIKFYGATEFDFNKKNYTYSLDLRSNGEEKLVVMNFPLYNGIAKLKIGVEENSINKPSRFENDKRIVIYGTSITQGGCASRPGLSFTNILSRRLNREFINLGFSGNGFGEAEVAEVISLIDNVEMFIIDYEANAGTNGLLEKNLEDFIKIIRGNNPKTPLVIISRIKYLFDDQDPKLGKRREEIRLFQGNTVNKLRALNDKNIHYIDGSILLGTDYHEFTVDTIHPNDLGFMAIANSLENRIRKLLQL